MKIVKKPSTGGASAHVIIDSGTVTQVTSISNPVAVTGTFYQATQPISSADGQQATIGTTTDASSALTLVGLLKNIKAALAGTITVAGTVTANIGSVATLALDATVAAVRDRLPASLGQKAMSASMSVTVASDQSGVPVTGTFWQGTQPVSGTFWQATQPVSGTVTANAGTNLNTSALALDSTVAKDATIVSSNTKLDTLHTDLALQAKLTDTQPVSVASLPLPSGAATDATPLIAANDARRAAEITLITQQMQFLSQMADEESYNSQRAGFEVR